MKRIIATIIFLLFLGTSAHAQLDGSVLDVACNGLYLKCTDISQGFCLYTCQAGSGGGASLTVEEVDASPSVTSVDKIQFDQADGFTVTSLGSGDVKIDLPEANLEALLDINDLQGDLAHTKIADLTPSSLLGNALGSSGPPESISLGTNLSMAGTVLNASGGSPGGSANDMQYNDGAGGFAGTAFFESDGSFSQHVKSTNLSSVPGTTRTRAFRFAPVTGTNLSVEAEYDGDLGFPVPMGRMLIPNGVTSTVSAMQCAWPSPGLTTVPNLFWNTQVTGTGSSPSWATTNMWTRIFARTQWASATTAGSSAGIRSGNTSFWRGNAANIGGFWIWSRIRIETTTAEQRFFVGLNTSGSVIGNVQPSSLTNAVYFGSDSAGANVNICHNDGSGTATCVDLGANYPALTAGAAYDMYLWAAPNAGSIEYAIQRLDSAQSTSGSLSTNLPGNTSPLAWHVWINNGTTAAASTIQWAGTCGVSNQ